MALPKEFNESLEEGLRDHPSLAKFNTPQDVVKAYVGVQPMIGADKIVIPKAGSDRKEFIQALKKLGVPETAEGYDVGEIKDLPKDFKRDAEFEKEFKAKAHELGILPWQFQEVMGWYLGRSGQKYQEYVNKTSQESEASVKELKDSWGSAYEQNLALANRVVKLLPESDQKFLYEEMSDNPQLIRVLHAIGSLADESKLKDSDRGSGSMLTPDQAKKEIAKIQGDKKHPYFIKSHPEHAIAVDRMNQLSVMAYGDKEYGE